VRYAAEVKRGPAGSRAGARWAPPIYRTGGFYVWGLGNFAGRWDPIFFPHPPGGYARLTYARVRAPCTVDRGSQPCSNRCEIPKQLLKAAISSAAQAALEARL
jgi:hypothetical protein